jgi:Ribonuclease G/E
MAIEIIRLLNLAASREHIKRIELSVSPEVAEYLQNEKRSAIAQIEQLSDKRVIIHSSPRYTGEKHDLTYYNEQGSVCKI